MATRTRTVLGVLAVGLGGGLVMYVSQFIEPGTSPVAIQQTQVVREVGSLTVLAVAAVAGFGLFDGHRVRRATPLVLVSFLAGGVVGYGVGLLALVVAPPMGFSIGSPAYTALLVGFEEVVPFTLSGFAGASVRALGTGGSG